jgi:hypothetical protein
VRSLLGEEEPLALKMALLHGWMPAVAKTVSAEECQSDVFRSPSSTESGRRRGEGEARRGKQKRDRRTVFFSQFESIAGALKVGARDQELGAADLASSADDGVEIIGVALGAVVSTPEYGICQVDADLLDIQGRSLSVSSVQIT